MKYLASDEPGWLHPDDQPPPPATKLLIYTKTGLALIGHWRNDDCLLWSPLPKISAELRQRLDNPRLPK